MSEKFTPGPWILDVDTCDEDGPLDVPEINGVIVDQDNCVVCMASTEANAHLITAAPDMYQEIKDMCRAELELGSCLPSDCNHCPMSRVLKKARGES